MPNTTDDDWRAFQERVADVYRSYQNCMVSVGERLHGTRIGTVEVDVVARFLTPPIDIFSHGWSPLEFMVIIECKFWRNRVPQEKIFALKTIVEDLGAAKGILVSELGVQKGVTEYLRAPNNIEVLTFNELKGSRPEGFYAACAKCGKTAILPFKPGARPVKCANCHKAERQQFSAASFPPQSEKT